MPFIAFIILVVIVLLILFSCIKIVPQAQALVVERLGAYLATWSVGVHFRVPFIDHVAKRVILKEQVVDFAPQPVITKDNVTMKIDTVVFFQITDPKLFAYGVENPIMAIENLTATTLRNIIGDLELDQTLTSRETINTKMRAALDVATDPWGIKVNRVELKNIIPPAAIQDAMEKQMKAERERREAILRAEGEKKSTILVAEGQKESAILEAEAEKEAAIRRNKERLLVFDWKYTLITAVAIIICVAAALMYVQGTVRLNNLSAQIADLKSEKENLLSEQNALQTEIDKNINLDEIRTFAEEELHMAYPGADQIIYYNSSTEDYFRQYESVDTAN